MRDIWSLTGQFTLCVWCACVAFFMIALNKSRQSGPLTKTDKTNSNTIMTMVAKNSKDTKTASTYHTFPKSFVWGTGTSCYQVEGATHEDHRGVSIWDTFCSQPGRILHNDTANVACDHYHRVDSDVQLMVQLGLKAYRFSIAWPRIIPTGEGKVNPLGIAFYNHLIDTLLENGIEPWVTLYHWDLPQPLQDKYNGWLGRETIDAFANYARVCFDAFGDRVKHWVTINEAWSISIVGYDLGEHAPGLSDNPALEPYIAGHYLLLAHAHAAHIYRREFAQRQGGIIGMTNCGDFRFPRTNNDADRAAAQRAMEFQFGWFSDPIYTGDYPPIMREMLGERLPTFTAEESALIKGSSDYFGLNHYSSLYAAEPKAPATYGGFFADEFVDLSKDPNWRVNRMGWCIVPDGCREMLKWIDERYDHPPIYILENGSAEDEPDLMTALHDYGRRDYFEGYIRACGEALDAGVDLRGYFAWSLMDNFEWQYGYDRRFGLYFVDFETLERTPKLSAKWYRGTMEANGGNIEKKV